MYADVVTREVSGIGVTLVSSKLYHCLSYGFLQNAKKIKVIHTIII